MEVKRIQKHTCTHTYIKVYLCLYTYICTYEKETSINYGCYFCNANFYEQPAKLPTPTKPKVSRCSLITRLHPNATHTLTYLYCIQSGLQLCQRALHMFGGWGVGGCFISLSQIFALTIGKCWTGRREGERVEGAKRVWKRSLRVHLISSISYFFS